MKELNKRMVANLPENRLKSSQKEAELIRATDYSKRKKIMDEYTKKLKDNVVSKGKNLTQSFNQSTVHN